MPDFKGMSRIELQPNDVDVPYQFYFTACSSASANDGWLPYGDGIASVVVTAWTSDGTQDSEIIAADTEVNDVVTLDLTYPLTNGPGRYKIRFVITTDDGATIEADFDRVYAKDK